MKFRPHRPRVRARSCALCALSQAASLPARVSEQVPLRGPARERQFASFGSSPFFPPKGEKKLRSVVKSARARARERVAGVAGFGWLLAEFSGLFYRKDQKTGKIAPAAKLLRTLCLIIL